jgi:hypothetical protein
MRAKNYEEISTSVRVREEVLRLVGDGCPSSTSPGHKDLDNRVMTEATGAT